MGNVHAVHGADKLELTQKSVFPREICRWQLVLVESECTSLVGHVSHCLSKYYELLPRIE